MFDKVRTILFLCILSSISVLILSLGNKFYLKSSPDIDEEIYKKILDIFEISYLPDNFTITFFDNFEKDKNSKPLVYISKTKNKGAYVIKNEAAGLWSVIEALVIVSPDRESLISLEILSHGETPGLGGLIEEENFLAQFRGLKTRPNIKVINNPTRDNEIDAIAGATVTSVAIENLVNNSIAIIDERIIK